MNFSRITRDPGEGVSRVVWLGNTPTAPVCAVGRAMVWDGTMCDLFLRRIARPENAF
jgi:hypothetical protein